MKRLSALAATLLMSIIPATVANDEECACLYSASPTVTVPGWVWLYAFDDDDSSDGACDYPICETGSGCSVTVTIGFTVPGGGTFHVKQTYPNGSYNIFKLDDGDAFGVFDAPLECGESMTFEAGGPGNSLSIDCGPDCQSPV